MKIIENNYKPEVETFPRQISCHWCQSIIEYNEADIDTLAVKLLKSKVSDPDKFINAPGFICPACNKAVIVG